MTERRPKPGPPRASELPPELAGAIVSSYSLPVAAAAELAENELEEIEEFEVVDDPPPAQIVSPPALAAVRAAPPPAAPVARPAPPTPAAVRVPPASPVARPAPAFPTPPVPAAPVGVARPAAPRGPAEPLKPASKHKDPAAAIVLVVEDDASIRTMIVRALGLTYTVYEAEDGAEAVRALEQIPNPACIVSDWMMPRMDGLELAKHVRADRALKMTPFLFLTAKNSALDVVQGINAGARHYLAKPFKMKELMDKVASVVGPRK